MNAKMLLAPLAAAVMLCACADADSSSQEVPAADTGASSTGMQTSASAVTSASGAAETTAPATSETAQSTSPAESTGSSGTEKTTVSSGTETSAPKQTSAPESSTGTSVRTEKSTTVSKTVTEKATHKDTSSPAPGGTESPKLTEGSKTPKEEDPVSAEEKPDESSSSDSQEEVKPAGILVSPEDIQLTDTDGRGRDYTFTYGGEVFTAHYTPDNWQIVYSYRITKRPDMEIIAAALITEHPIHGRDMVSYREPGDMADEWEIHNTLYNMLPEGDLRLHARDVDFDPGDQGLTLWEMYMRRFG